MLIDLPTLRSFFQAAPYMVELGIEPTVAEPGKIVTTMILQPRHHQHTGHVHAGVCSAMADHSMGAAAQTLVPAGQWIMTAELKTSHLRAAQGEHLECRASVIKPGRNLVFTEAEVWCVTGAERNLVVKASATMAVTQRR